MLVCPQLDERYNSPVIISGCVLCSPGCFSMFRGSALIDDNIMAMYTTPASEAKHYVQYDQGKALYLQTVKIYFINLWLNEYANYNLTSRRGQMALYTDVATRLQS